MTLSEIMGKCKALKIHEDRGNDEETWDLVFFSKDKDIWYKTFTEMLGAPKKPEGLEPTKEDEGITEEYGGIFSNQTLFKKDDKDATIMAMFWPWQDKTHTTLKVIFLKK